MPILLQAKTLAILNLGFLTNWMKSGASFLRNGSKNKSKAFKGKGALQNVIGNAPFLFLSWKMCQAVGVSVSSSGLLVREATAALTLSISSSTKPANSP